MAVTARASSDRMRAPGLPIVPEHEETVPYTQTAFCVRLFSSRKCRGRASGSRPVCTTGAINTYILKVLRCRLRLDSSAICTRSLVQQALQRCQLHTPSWNYAPAMREHWQNKERTCQWFPLFCQFSHLFSAAAAIFGIRALRTELMAILHPLHQYLHPASPARPDQSVYRSRKKPQRFSTIAPHPLTPCLQIA